MKRMAIAGLLSAAGAALLVGCGGSSDSSTLDLEGFVAELADTTCNALVDCSCTDASALADCKTVYREMYLYEFAQDLAGSPAVKVDPTAAATCLADLRTQLQSCHALYGLADLQGVAAASPGRLRAVSRSYLGPDSCDLDLIYVGTQTEGEYCSGSSDCAPGLGCDDQTDACAPLGAAGASCASVGCQDGLYCDSSVLCAALPGEGQACPDSACQDGLACLSVDGTYTCVAPSAVGAACGLDGCVDGAYCDETSHCAAQKDVGAECASSSECLYGPCGDDGKCTDLGLCASFGRK